MNTNDKMQPTSSADSAERPLSSIDDEELIYGLREYAANNGFSHGDYADSMTMAADRIESLLSYVANLQASIVSAMAQVPIGEAGTMPGTTGFTMACFKAEEVPLGTKLYAASIVPQVVQAPIAYVNSDELDNMLDDRTAEIQSNKSGWRGTPLYAAPIVATVPSEFDVRTILLDVVPGDEGMGLEIYAKNVADVERVLTEMSERIDSLEHAAPSTAEQASDVPDALRLLSMMVDGYENGIACQEGDNGEGNFIGNAFRIDDESFDEMCNLLNRRNAPCFDVRDDGLVVSATPADKGNAPAEAES